MDEIAQEDCTYESLLKIFQSLYHEQDIRVVVSWLEYLRLVAQKDGIITVRLDDSEYEDDERPDGIYPMKSDIEINVKEDKMSVFEYLRKIEKGMIVMDPDFQRHLVWKNSQKSMFIESAKFLLNTLAIYSNCAGDIIKTSLVMFVVCNCFMASFIFSPLFLRWFYVFFIRKTLFIIFITLYHKVS